MTIHDLPTPLLLLDWPVAQRNILTAAKMVESSGAKLRPHFKSHKCVPLAREQLAAALDAATKGDKEERIFLRADRAVPYGDVMQVMNELRGDGYLKIALVALETREAK